MPKNRVYPDKVKERTRRLRKRGWSLGEISQSLNIPKNTLSGWVKEIILTGRLKQRIKKKEITSAAKGRILAAKVLKQKLENWKESIQKRTRQFSKMPFKNAKTGKLICGILYVCEGSKYPTTRCLSFANSDPKMIKFFLSMLRKYFNVDEKKFRCRVQQRCDQGSNELKRFWSSVTKIPLSQFYKNYADKRTEGKLTAKKDYKGVCTLQYFDTNLQFELQAIGEAVINGRAE